MLQTLLKNFKEMCKITEYRYCGLSTGGDGNDEQGGESGMLRNDGLLGLQGEVNKSASARVN